MNLRYSDNTSLSGRSVIVCELFLDVDSALKVEQLTEELQSVENKNMEYLFRLNLSSE